MTPACVMQCVVWSSLLRPVALASAGSHQHVSTLLHGGQPVAPPVMQTARKATAKQATSEDLELPNITFPALPCKYILNRISQLLRCQSNLVAFVLVFQSYCFEGRIHFACVVHAPSVRTNYTPSVHAPSVRNNYTPSILKYLMLGQGN